LADPQLPTPNPTPYSLHAAAHSSSSSSCFAAVILTPLGGAVAQAGVADGTALSVARGSPKAFTVVIHGQFDPSANHDREKVSERLNYWFHFSIDDLRYTGMGGRVGRVPLACAVRREESRRRRGWSQGERTLSTPSLKKGAASSHVAAPPPLGGSECA
jgi:hypothetical protein